LIIHGFLPNVPANKEGFRQFIYLLWKAFPDIRIMFEDIIIEENKVVCRYNLAGHTRVNLWVFSQPINNSKLMV
jgi:predicted ester cyclase